MTTLKSLINSYTLMPASNSKLGFCKPIQQQIPLRIEFSKCFMIQCTFAKMQTAVTILFT